MSVLFSIFAVYGAGLVADLWGLVLLLIGLAVRWGCRHRLAKAHLPQADAPARARLMAAFHPKLPLTECQDSDPKLTRPLPSEPN